MFDFNNKRKEVMKKKQINHQNPCDSKIMYPLLRTTSRRTNSLTPPTNDKLNTPEKKRHDSEDKKNPQHKKQSFLSECFEKVAIQNACLIKTLDMKRNELYSLNREIKRQDNQKQNPHIRSKWLISQDVILSVDSIEQQSNDESIKGLVSKEYVQSEKEKGMMELKQKLEGLDFTRMERFRRKKYK